MPPKNQNNNSNGNSKAAKSARGQTYRAQNSKQSARAAMSAMRAPQMGDAATRYAHALISPFAKEAEGVRVPEPYAVATVTRKVHVPFVLTSNAAGGLDFSIQPHLIASVVQTLGTATGGSALATSNLPAGMTMRSAVTQSALAALMQTYRVVAIGVRLKTNIDFTKSGGRVYAAIMPASQELPRVFNVGTTTSQAFAAFEIPNDGTNVSANIINLPRGFQFTVSELMSEGGCEIHFPICSARALDFLDAQDQSFEQHLTYTSGAGVELAAGAGLGSFAAAGHSQLVIRAEGLQASTDVFTCEVIYHAEGIPLVGTASFVESTPHTASPASPNEIHYAHRIAAAQPVVKYVSDKLREYAGRNVGTKKGNAASTGARLGGAAERVLGIAVRGLGLL